MRILLALAVVLIVPADALAGTVSLEGGVLRYSGTEPLRISVVVADQGNGQGCSGLSQHACVTAFQAPYDRTYTTTALTAGAGCRQVSGLDGPSTLCEGPITSVDATFGEAAERFDVRAPGRPVRAAMGGGNDQVFAGTPSNGGPSALQLDLGAGDDVARGEVSGTATVDFGPGDDEGELNGQQGSTVLGGDGNDTLTEGGTVGGPARTLDGGAGDDVLRSGVVDGLRVVGGPGDDTINVLPPYVGPVAGTVQVSCGAGKDLVNEGYVRQQLVGHQLGQRNSVVRPGVVLASDCPPVPKAFPYFLGARARKDRMVTYRITVQEPVTLRIRTIPQVRKPFAFSRTKKLKPGRNTVRFQLPAAVVTAARKSAGSDKVGGRIYLRFFLIGRDGERWSFDNDANAIGLHFR